MNVFPILGEAEFVGTLAGVRPGSPDGVPLMGPVPGWEGLSVASGHDHAGIMLSSGSGELMADYIVSSDATALEAFLPSRLVGDATPDYMARPLFWNITHEK